MSVFVVHFPDGSKEFRYPEREIEIGDRLSHGGVQYRVLAIGGQGARDVTVEPDSEDLGDVLRSEKGAFELVLSGG
jgi:hypothetical protein